MRFRLGFRLTEEYAPYCGNSSLMNGGLAASRCADVERYIAHALGIG